MVTEPASMPRLECDAAIELFSQYGEKRTGDAGVECKTRRSCTSRQPRREPSGARSARKDLSSSALLASR